MTEGTRVHAAGLEVQDLEVRFASRRLFGGSGGEVRAVDGVSFDVDPGEVFCIAGESGCGKTTLGRALLGLVRPHSGNISIFGLDPSRLRGEELRKFRRQVQVIFQDPMGSLNPRQSVYEAVAEGVRIHGLQGDEKEIVAQALTRAGLRPPERYFLSYPHELSGGQRQRVVIASAIALEPRVLVADEPVSMLDASVRGEVLELLVRLKDEVGMTLVLITHDLAFAWALADRIAIMYLGKIVELGPAQTLLTEPLHPYTKSLLAVTPEVGRRRIHEVLTGEPPDPAHIPPGCRFHPRCPVLRSGEAGSQEPRCLGEVPVLEGPVPGHRAACHVSAARGARTP
ncbi:MAG TPA: ABC transporter ATP-binding protein [Rubrobacter sp.]|nr:ABC transporter ATP-binding protein [Rubrobacter sp.]